MKSETTPSGGKDEEQRKFIHCWWGPPRTALLSNSSNVRTSYNTAVLSWAHSRETLVQKEDTRECSIPRYLL